MGIEGRRGSEFFQQDNNADQLQQRSYCGVDRRDKKASAAYQRQTVSIDEDEDDGGHHGSNLAGMQTDFNYREDHSSG